MVARRTTVQMIPLNDIHVANPRVRNQRIHRAIIKSIEAIGLKRPISVRPAAPDESAQPYALICGQGRLEAYKVLGFTEIPALILDVDEHLGHVMSIVENLARRTPKAAETMEQIQVLRERGYSDGEIGRKLGCTTSWVNSVANLMGRGERRLLAAVEAGHISLALAVSISRANDSEAQQLLMDAYESGDLKGKKVTTVRKILANRARSGRKGAGGCVSGSPRRKLTPEDLAKLYKRDVEAHQRIQKKAEFTQQSVLLARQVFKELLALREFCDLLHKEGLCSLPQPLADLLPSRASKQ